MRAKYVSDGVRGKYVDRYRRETNVALLDPELAEAFPDSKSVKGALRALVAIDAQRKRESARDRGPGPPNSGTWRTEVAHKSDIATLRPDGSINSTTQRDRHQHGQND